MHTNKEENAKNYIENVATIRQLMNVDKVQVIKQKHIHESFQWTPTGMPRWSLGGRFVSMEQRSIPDERMSTGKNPPI